MATNNQEIEVKFKLKDSQGLRKKLKKLEAKCLGRAFERTLRFDTKNGDLEKEGKFLRLRTGFSDTLTFKCIIKDKKYRRREEIELVISDPEKMRTILERLNFTKVLIMEKYREKWRLKGAEVVIDELPMGKYIEIEGTEKKIEYLITFFGLDRRQKILGTYWDLWRDFARKNHIREKSIIFRR